MSGDVDGGVVRSRRSNKGFQRQQQFQDQMSTQGGGGGGGRRVRADINDAIAALAREAGWVVLPDGTTFPSRSQGARPAAGGSTTVLASLTSLPLQQNQAAFLRGISSASPIGIDDEACQMKDTIDARQVVDMPSNLQQRDFAGTPYVPVYVLLP
ncbi:beta-amylase 7, partial [Tanacetum coccineum]